MRRLAQARADRHAEAQAARLHTRILEGVHRFSNDVLTRLLAIYSNPALSAPRECVGCGVLNHDPPMVLRWMCRCGTTNESSYRYYQRILDIVEYELIQRRRIAS